MTGIYKDIIKSKKVFLIAEAGVNHNGSLVMAKKMIDVARQAGCDAVKFQTFKTDNVVSSLAEKAPYQKKTGSDKESQYDMVKRLELDHKAHKKLFDYCRKQKILFLSTAFDEESADFLVALGLPLFKIPSGEITNYPLIKKIAKTKRPVILSTGMSTLKEIKEAVMLIRRNGNKKIILLQCTTAYPTPIEEANVRVMKTLQNSFNLPVGFSDHTLGINASLSAAALGACVIEKHFTLDNDLPGPDHKASLSPEELRLWTESIRDIEKSLGSLEKRVTPSEKENRDIARKSLVASRDLTKGHVINKNDICIKRPGTGIAPQKTGEVVGRVVKSDIEKDSVLTWRVLC